MFGRQANLSAFIEDETQPGGKKSSCPSEGMPKLLWDGAVGRGEM